MFADDGDRKGSWDAIKIAKLVEGLVRTHTHKKGRTYSDNVASHFCGTTSEFGKFPSVNQPVGSVILWPVLATLCK